MMNKKYPGVYQVVRASGRFHFRTFELSAQLNKTDIVLQCGGNPDTLQEEIEHYRILGKNLPQHSGIYHIVPPEEPSPPRSLHAQNIYPA